MNESELEDIESHLYSQIYHHQADHETDETEPQQKNFSKPVTDMKKPGRYFGPWRSSASKTNKLSSPKQNNSKAPIRNDHDKSHSFYSKNPTTPHKPDVSINQVVVLSPQSPIVCMTAKELRRAQWREKTKNKRKKYRAQKWAKRSINNKFEGNDSVITLSDSEDDSCVLVDNNWPVLLVDSDEENRVVSGEKKSDVILTLKTETIELNESFTDDVIFIEPSKIPDEVIDIDEESVSSPQKVNSSPPRDQSVQQLYQERKELLNTPDSASNDFMNNYELNQKNFRFNFSLHGSDFNSGEFLKPGKRTETCETESSSSTTDRNPDTLMKTAVFNEIEFPKDELFSENNLESFGNFITPSRKGTNVVRAQSTPIKPVEVQNDNVYSSGSSSESDFEEPQVDKPKKSLPELSPMQSKKEINIPSAKKSKKLAMSSKYDLIVSDSGKQEKQNKKKKKCKKKRSDSKNTEDESEPVDSSLVTIEDELKHKKRNSDQTESVDESTESNSRKKKSKKKKHDSVGLGDTEITDNVQPLEIQNTENEDSGIQKITEINEESKGANDEQDKNNEKDKIDNFKNVEKETISSNEPSPLEGLVIIDETFDDKEVAVVLSSDSESILSPLHEQQDITINCEGPIDVHSMPSTSKSVDLINFEVKDIQLTMSNDPKLWVILDRDRMPYYGRSKGRRCNKCREMGHMAIRCPNKVEIKCQLCGQRGHYEPRCPNKICTQCGQRSPYSTTYCGSCFKLRTYQCELCLMMGHLSNSCPDLWRRYHMTTTEGPPVIYDGPILKQKHQLWCSSCAQSGHLQHSCHFNKSSYPPSDPFIKSYEDIYVSPDERNRGAQFVAPQSNYENLQPNFMADQEYLMGYNNYNQNYNPYLEGVFMDNQQNFYPSGPGNMIQYPTQNNRDYCFEDNLPNFISFDNQYPTQSYQEVPKTDSVRRYLRKGIHNKTGKHCNSIFFSSPATTLQHFINEELQKLAKLSFTSNKLVKEFRRRRVPVDTNEREEYYHTLNMVLFGIFNLLQGKMHLERLKGFKLNRVHSKIQSGIRKNLHRSYSYIFGHDRHENVNYNELLRRI